VSSSADRVGRPTFPPATRATYCAERRRENAGYKPTTRRLLQKDQPRSNFATPQF
jgi:hypothetical protein